MDPRAVVELEDKCYRDGDYAGMAELYAEDAEFTTPDGGVLRGRDEIIDYTRREAEAFSDNEYTATIVAVDGPTVVVEWSWEGTHQHDLRLPSGTTLPATNRRLKVDAVAIARVESGRFVRVRRYHDRLSVMTQLGLLPATSEQ